MLRPDLEMNDDEHFLQWVGRIHQIVTESREVGIVDTEAVDVLASLIPTLLCLSHAGQESLDYSPGRGPAVERMWFDREVTETFSTRAILLGLA